MDKYEYKVRSEEIAKLIDKENYAEAAKIADTIDWRRVKSANMLLKVAALYRLNRRLEDSKALLVLAYERYPTNRSVVYNLCEVSIELNDVVAAIEHYKQYMKLAPKENGAYILRYHILEISEASLEERIEVLEELKKRDYQEEWAYELAYLYHRVGFSTKCIEECDDIMLWFGDGPYVMKAMELKKLHAPLTEIQQEKYNAMLNNSEENDTEKNENKENYSIENYDTGIYDKTGYSSEEAAEYPNQDGYAQDGYSQDMYGAENYMQNDGYNENEYEAEHYQNNGYDGNSYDTGPYEQNIYGSENGIYESGIYAQGNDYNEIYPQNNHAYGSEAYAQNDYSDGSLENEAYMQNAGYQENAYENETYMQEDGFQETQAYDSNGNYSDNTYENDGYSQNGYVDDGYGNISYINPSYQDSGYTGEFYVEQLYDTKGNLINPNQENNTYNDAANRTEYYGNDAYGNSIEENNSYGNSIYGNNAYGNSALKKIDYKSITPVQDIHSDAAVVPAASNPSAASDMSQYNTINLQKVVAESMKEIFPDDDAFEEERERINAEELAKSDLATNTNGSVSGAENALFGVSDAKTGFTSTGKIAQIVTGVSEIAPDQNTGAVKKVIVPGEDARIIKEEPDIRKLWDTTETTVGEEHARMENNEENVYHEKNIFTTHPPTEEKPKQATGKMRLQEVLEEWEQKKRDNAKKHEEEIKQHVLTQTGRIFAEFDNSIKSGILGELEREEEESKKQMRKVSDRGFLEADDTSDLPQMRNKKTSENEFDVAFVPKEEKTENPKEEQKEELITDLERAVARELGMQTSEISRLELFEAYQKMQEEQQKNRENHNDKNKNTNSDIESKPLENRREEEVSLNKDDKEIRVEIQQDDKELERIEPPVEALSNNGYEGIKNIEQQEKIPSQKTNGEEMILQNADKNVDKNVDKEIKQQETILKEEHREIEQEKFNAQNAYRGTTAINQEETLSKDAYERIKAIKQIIKQQEEAVSRNNSQKVEDTKYEKEDAVIESNVIENNIIEENAVKDNAVKDDFIGDGQEDTKRIDAIQDIYSAVRNTPEKNDRNSRNLETKRIDDIIRSGYRAAQSVIHHGQVGSANNNYYTRNDSIEDRTVLLNVNEVVGRLYKTNDQRQDNSIQTDEENTYQDTDRKWNNRYNTDSDESDYQDSNASYNLDETDDQEPVYDARTRYERDMQALDPEDAESIAEMAKEDALKTQEIKMNTADLSALSEKIVATTKKEATGARREEIRDFTQEEQTLFENFAVTKKIKKQIIYALDNMTLAAYTGNVIITGNAGIDTVRMAKNLMKVYQDYDGGFSGKAAKITGEKLNQRNLKEIFAKLNNGGIIIEKANGMSEEKLYEMSLLLNQESVGIVVIMEDTKKEITKLLEKQAMIADYFNIRIDLMEMDNNALVAYAKNYALALEYSIDELGILALYTRITNMQSGNHVVTKDEVRDIIDEAIYKSKKSKIKNFVDVLFSRRYDNEDMIVLKERDFI